MLEAVGIEPMLTSQHTDLLTIIIKNEAYTGDDLVRYTYCQSVAWIIFLLHLLLLMAQAYGVFSMEEKRGRRSFDRDFRLEVLRLVTEEGRSVFALTHHPATHMMTQSVQLISLL